MLVRRDARTRRIDLSELVISSGGGGAAAFSPSDLAGLVAWYDKSDITTLFTDAARTIAVTADGDVIGGVTDLSGSGNHATQATTADKPIYDTDVSPANADFDGSSDYLSIPSVAGLQAGDNDVTIGVWLQMKSKSAAFNESVFNKWTNADDREYILQYNGPSDRYQFFWRTAGGSNIGVLADDFGPVTLNTWQFVVAQREKSSGTTYISVDSGTRNTATGATAGNSGVADVNIGRLGNGVDYAPIRVGACYFYQSFLTETEIDSLYSYGPWV